MGKIVSKEEFSSIRKSLKEENKKIVLCHGVFDLVHPGHIIHFEEAKQLGDVLVVSITASKYVRKGIGRPYFNDEMRLKVLSSIEFIDYVLISVGFTVDDMIECIQPDLYVKGQEYADADKDITGKISEETELVRRYGGDVYFTGGQVFSSTKLLNNCMPSITPEVKDFMLRLKERFSFEQVQQYVEKFKQAKVLVIGDAIIDNYVFCDMQGIMSKDMGYSVRYEEEKQYLGGVLAIARHIAEYTDNVTLSSIIGNESDLHSKILNDLGKNMRLDLIYSEECSTVEKKRYITVNKKREEFNKIFSVNNLPENQKIVGQSKEQFVERIKEIMPEYDLVVLCDFGHGLIDDEVMTLIEEKAKFLSLNCQTNSSNYGMNLITKYKKADAFVLDQRELKLAFHDRSSQEEVLLERLIQQMNSTGGWLTQASLGATGIMGDGEAWSCPALTLDVKDTIGAGDAFFAVASLCAVTGVPVMVSTFLGNIAGALASNIIGNERQVEKVDLLKYANTLMNI